MVFRFDKLRSLSAAFILSLNLGLFYLTPLSILEQIVIPSLSLIGVFLLINKFTSILSIFRVWILVFLVLGFISVYTNIYHTKVSLTSSFIGSLAYFKVLSLIPVYFLLSSPKRVSTTIHYLVVIAITWWVLTFAFFLLDLNFTYKSPFTGSTLLVSGQNLNKTLINLISILFLSIFLVKRSYKFLLGSFILFSANMFGDFQRYIFVCFSIVVFAGFFFQRSRKLKLSLLPLSAVLVLTTIIVLSFTQIGSIVITKFSDVIALFSEQGYSDDFSVSARIWQSEIALEGFSKHPLIGNGVFRASVKEAVFGDAYFHLSDIGLIGILYAFGILGILVYLMQVRYYLRLRPKDSLQLTVKLFMLFLLLFSILTGLSVLTPSVFMLAVLFSALTEKSYKVQKALFASK